MTTLATVLKSGGRYDLTWVERLARGARRHIPGLQRFVCLTDAPIAPLGTEVVRLRHDWPAWWSKMEVFRAGLFQGTVILCDLDTVFIGDAGRLTEPGLAAMEDYFHGGRVSTALMRWKGDELSILYETFAAEPQRWMAPGSCGQVPNSVHGDQVVVDHMLRSARLKPQFFQRAYRDLLDFYDPKRVPRGPIVIFIGETKPDNSLPPMQSLWRGETQG